MIEKGDPVQIEQLKFSTGFGIWTNDITYFHESQCDKEYIIIQARDKNGNVNVNPDASPANFPLIIAINKWTICLNAQSKRH